MNGIVVYQSTDREGATFALSRETREFLKRRFGDAARLSPRIFIARETQHDFEQIHGKLAKQLVALLTGLSTDKLENLPVEFRDAVTRKLVSS